MSNPYWKVLDHAKDRLDLVAEGGGEFVVIIQGTTVFTVIYSHEHEDAMKLIEKAKDRLESTP